MPNEIITTMSSEDYHKDKGIGKSRLDAVHRSINHFLMPASEPGPALILGSALHCAFLEPELFAVLFIKDEKNDKRTVEGKTNDKNWTEENYENFRSVITFLKENYNLKFKLLKELL